MVLVHFKLIHLKLSVNLIWLFHIILKMIALLKAVKKTSEVLFYVFLSEDQSRLAARKYARVVQKLGFPVSKMLVCMLAILIIKSNFFQSPIRWIYLAFLFYYLRTFIGIGTLDSVKAAFSFPFNKSGFNFRNRKRLHGSHLFGKLMYNTYSIMITLANHNTGILKITG